MINNLYKNITIWPFKAWDSFLNFFSGNETYRNLKSSLYDFKPPFEIYMVSFLIGVLGLALPIALLQVYDRIIPNSSFGTVTLLAVGVVMAIIIETIMRFSRLVFLGHYASRIEEAAYARSFNHLLNSKVESIEQTGSGEQLERLSAIGQLKSFYAGPIAIALLDLPFALIFIGVLYYLVSWLAFIPLILFAILITISVKISKQLRSDREQLDQVEENRVTFFISALSHIFSVKSLALELPLLRKFEAIQGKRVSLAQKTEASISFLRDINNVVSQLAIALVAGLGCIYVLDGSLTVGALAASTILTGRTLQPAQGISNFLIRSQVLQNSRKRLDNIFDVETDQQESTSTVSSENLKGAINLENISLHYSGAEDFSLKNVNLNVKPMEMVAISGPNNSGKSSLLSILAGITQPTNGEITYDGLPIRNIDPQVFRKQVAYLPQNEIIFSGTILENITLFRPEKWREAMVSAKILGIEGYINGLPKGFHTMVGEGPQHSLPRGLAQLIAISRILIDKPSVILFDDANSAVDYKGDETVKKLLLNLKGDATFVIVSHRPSILKIADRVLHLESGELDVEALDL